MTTLDRRARAKITMNIKNNTHRDPDVPRSKNGRRRFIVADFTGDYGFVLAL